MSEVVIMREDRCGDIIDPAGISFGANLSKDEIAKFKKQLEEQMNGQFSRMIEIPKSAAAPPMVQVIDIGPKDKLLFTMPTGSHHPQDIAEIIEHHWKENRFFVLPDGAKLTVIRERP